MKSLRESANPDCEICKGSGQDTTTTGFTAVCECVKSEESERTFTLAEALEIWDASNASFRDKIDKNAPKAPNKYEYFKEKFNIDLNK